MKKYVFLLVLTTSCMLTGGLVYKSIKDSQPVPPPTTYATPLPDVAVPQPTPVPVVPAYLTVDQAKELITVEKNQKVLYWLADDAREGRMSGKKGNKEAAEYVKTKFESFGLKTSYQKFPIRRMNPGPHREEGDDFTQNVIGVLPGETDRVIIVASHVDHVGWGPQMTLDNRVGIHNGADDNGSGTTGVIACAEAFSRIKTLKHTIVFITFSGEEMGLIGSQYYVKQLGQQGLDKIDLMVNFDMIGRLAPRKSCKAIGARNNPELTRLIGNLEKKYTITFEPTTGDGDDNSDHAPFRKLGVPVCFFFTGLHDKYHRVTDKPDTIDYVGLTEITKFAFEMVCQYDTYNRKR